VRNFQLHANRVVQELRRLGVVEWDAKQIKIRDWDALVRLADFSGEYLQLGAEVKDNQARLPDILLPTSMAAEPDYID